MRTATQAEITALEQEAHSRGWDDGVMRRECAAPYPDRSMLARKYRAVYVAGEQHRKFLSMRSMRLVRQDVQRDGAGWRWRVLVEGVESVSGSEKTRKLAEGAAESVAVDLAFKPAASVE